MYVTPLGFLLSGGGSAEASEKSQSKEAVGRCRSGFLVSFEERSPDDPIDRNDAFIHWDDAFRLQVRIEPWNDWEMWALHAQKLGLIHRDRDGWIGAWLGGLGSMMFHADRRVCFIIG